MKEQSIPENIASKMVSIIIPCYNEEHIIGVCMDSIVNSDYSKDFLEVLVVDGISTDNTRVIVQEYSDKHKIFKLLKNERQFTPFAFNIGINNAKGDIIFLMGAHSSFTPDYISKCVYNLNEYQVDNVGGMAKIIPRENTLMGNSIAVVMSHPFGVGNAEYKHSYDDEKTPGEPKLVDTVFGGCYRADVFRRVGLFNENLRYSQDMEFNVRLRKAGGKILLVPDIVTVYYARSKYPEFVKWTINNGISVITPMEYTKAPMSVRHIIPLLFFLGIIVFLPFSIFSGTARSVFLIMAAIYLAAAFYHAQHVAKIKKDFRYFFSLPLVFFSYHFFYGLGSLKGIIQLIAKKLSGQ